jgi:hypothetical protein
MSSRRSVDETSLYSDCGGTDKDAATESGSIEYQTTKQSDRTSKQSDETSLFLMAGSALSKCTTAAKSFINRITRRKKEERNPTEKTKKLGGHGHLDGHGSADGSLGENKYKARQRDPRTSWELGLEEAAQYRKPVDDVSVFC